MSHTAGNTGVPYQDGYVHVAGLRLHYVDFGGTGEVLVCLHGFIGNAHCFDSIAPVLVPHVHVIGLDLRGRGDSDRGPPDRYVFDQYLIDLIGFLKALGLERVALLGTSLGGRLARTYTLTHPDRVTRLVLNDSALGGGMAEIARVVRRLAKAPPEFANLQEAVAWFLGERTVLARLDPPTRETWVKHYLTPTPAGGWRFQCDPAIIRGAIPLLQNIAESVRHPGYGAAVWQMVRRLAVPVLILRGEISDVIPYESAEQLARALPAGQHVEIPGVGHAPTLHEPEAQAALRDFFGVPARQPPTTVAAPV